MTAFHPALKRMAVILFFGMAAALNLTACGGGSGSSSTGGGTVEGVATPSSISVVTANNAD